MRRRTLLLSAAVAIVARPGQGWAADDALARAVQAPGRSAKFVARDGARHPLEELAFFGVGPTSSVV